MSFQHLGWPAGGKQTPSMEKLLDAAHGDRREAVWKTNIPTLDAVAGGGSGRVLTALGEAVAQYVEATGICR